MSKVKKAPSISRRSVRRFVCGVISAQISSYLEAGQPHDDFEEAIRRGDVTPEFAHVFVERLSKEFKREAAKYHSWSAK